jgi:hypothetical protein
VEKISLPSEASDNIFALLLAEKIIGMQSFLKAKILAKKLFLKNKPLDDIAENVILISSLKIGINLNVIKTIKEKAKGIFIFVNSLI